MSRIANDVANVELPGDWTQTVSREYIDNLEDNLRGDISAEADRATQKEGELEGKFNNYTPTLDIPGIKVDQAKKADVADKLNAGATMGGKEVATVDKLTDGSVTKVSDNATNVSGDTVLVKSKKKQSQNGWKRIIRLNEAKYDFILNIIGGFSQRNVGTQSFFISSCDSIHTNIFQLGKSDNGNPAISKLKIAKKGNFYYVEVFTETLESFYVSVSDINKYYPINIEIISEDVEADENTIKEINLPSNTMAINGSPIATTDGTVERTNQLINLGIKPDDNINNFYGKNYIGKTFTGIRRENNGKFPDDLNIGAGFSLSIYKIDAWNIQVLRYAKSSEGTPCKIWKRTINDGGIAGKWTELISINNIFGDGFPIITELDTTENKLSNFKKPGVWKVFTHLFEDTPVKRQYYLLYNILYSKNDIFQLVITGAGIWFRQSNITEKWQEVAFVGSSPAQASYQNFNYGIEGETK